MEKDDLEELRINIEDTEDGKIYFFTNKTNPNEKFFGIFKNHEPKYSIKSIIDNDAMENPFRYVYPDKNSIYKFRGEDSGDKISPYKIATELIKSSGAIWDEKEKTIKEVRFIFPLNILPLDKFLGLTINRVYPHQALGNMSFDFLYGYDTQRGQYIGTENKRYVVAVPITEYTLDYYFRRRKENMIIGEGYTLIDWRL